jgi:hypothetical protein
MKPYFVGHPVATALFVATLLVFALVQGRQALQRRSEATVMDRGSRSVLALCWIVGLLVAALVRTRVPAAALPNTAVTFGLGLVVVWLGLGLRWWSFQTLGRYYTGEGSSPGSASSCRTGSAWLLCSCHRSSGCCTASTSNTQAPPAVPLVRSVPRRQMSRGAHHSDHRSQTVAADTPRSEASRICTDSERCHSLGRIYDMAGGHRWGHGEQ